MEEVLNRTVIEMASIVKLEDSLLRTGVIEPNISRNDKTPSWDGEVRLYSSCHSFRKSELIGRIPIQVKGMQVERFQKSKAAFQAEVNDLRNYLTDGGVIFFLIQIKDFDNYKIWYSSLQPFDLRRLLENTESQKTKRIKLDAFPTKYKNGIVRVFSTFLANREKQAKLLPNIRSIQDLEKTNMEIERFELYIPSADADEAEDVLKELFENPQYVYVKPKNIETTFVVDRIQIDEITEHQNVPITVDGTVLFEHIDCVRKPGDNKVIKIGTDITAIEYENGMKFEYSFRGSLREQIREMLLLIAFQQNKVVKIGNKTIHATNCNMRGHTLDEAIERLNNLKMIDKTFKLLHVKKDLSLGSLSKREIQNLQMLVNGILRHVVVPLRNNGAYGYGKLTIGNITVLLSSKKSPDGAGIILKDFFTDELCLAPEGVSPEKGHLVSPFILMTADMFGQIDNADLSSIVSSIRKFPFCDIYGERITYLLLELVKYYDMTKSNECLTTALQLLDFLQECDDSQEVVCQINRLQIEKRRRKLEDKEIKYLVSLKQQDIPVQFQLAANILLESFQEAQLIYNQLSEEEQQIFDAFPIKALWAK